jgi:hypothetical protein
MATPFGAPIFNEAEDPTTQVGDSPLEVMDPNDPVFTSEDLNVNPDVDAYAYPPPPPDGKYRAKLKLAPHKNADGSFVDWYPAKWGKDKTPVLVTGVEASIIDPTGKFDGVKVFDRLVSTLPNRESGTKVSTILAKLHRPDGSPWASVTNKPKSHVGWMSLLKQALAGEPEIGIETNWEWSCQDCGKDAQKAGESRPKGVKGMHKFPQHRGVFQPEMRCQIKPAHGESRAQVRIERFLSEGELKQASVK